jgi:hypothetical protein
MKYIFSIVLVSAIISAWGQNQETPMVTERAKLLLKSGFEEGVFINDEMTDICGSDVSGFSWDATPSWISSSRFEYVVGKDKNIRNFMEAAIEPTIGPFGKTTWALRLTNIADDKDHSATSRVEFSFFGKESPDDYQQGFVRYWMKLQGNLGELIPDNRETPFYMLMEWKEPNSNNSMNARQCKDCCNANAGGTNNYPVVCMDESSKQLIEEVASTPIKPGQEARLDYEYIRHGMVNVFMANEPLKGKRLVEVTEYKTKKEWARFMKRIADEMYPMAKKDKTGHG